MPVNPDQPAFDLDAAVGTGAAAQSGCETAGPSVGTHTAKPDATPPAATPCPTCATPATSRFCENCGFDLLMARLVASVAPGHGTTGGGVTSTQGGTASTSQAGAASMNPSRTGAPNAGRHGTATAGLDGHAADGSASEEVPALGAWRIVVAADPAYHARMQSEAQPGFEPIAFPAYCPRRRFTLDGDQVLIGRRSRSRGIEPQIDLTGPPEDPAVSHAHALLIAQQDGGWSVVDLDSANGTYVNGAKDPIEASIPVRLVDGDRVHIGAWTTLTLMADR